METEESFTSTPLVYYYWYRKIHNNVIIVLLRGLFVSRIDITRVFYLSFHKGEGVCSWLAAVSVKETTKTKGRERERERERESFSSLHPANSSGHSILSHSGYQSLFVRGWIPIGPRVPSGSFFRKHTRPSHRVGTWPFINFNFPEFCLR